MRANSLFVAAIAILALTACQTNDERPTRSEWEGRWITLTALLPDAAEIQGEESKGKCAETLAYLRVLSEAIEPTPNQTLDQLSKKWLEVAQGAFFDCPPDNPDFSSFSEVDAELDRLEQAVEEALEESVRGGVDMATTSTSSDSS